MLKRIVGVMFVAALVWSIAAAPVISLAILATTPNVDYRGLSAIVVALWILAPLIARGTSRSIRVSFLMIMALKLVLESTTSLSSANWQPVIEMPRDNNGRWEVIVATDQRERYFRLHSP